MPVIVGLVDNNMAPAAVTAWAGTSLRATGIGWQSLLVLVDRPGLGVAMFNVAKVCSASLAVFSSSVPEDLLLPCVEGLGYALDMWPSRVVLFV